MFFARIAIAALSVAGVLAAPFVAREPGSHHLDLARIGVKVPRSADVSSYNTALTQLKDLKSQVGTFSLSFLLGKIANLISS